MSSLNQAQTAIDQGQNVRQQTDAALRQTDAALIQGRNIGTLTKMTVYVAFPVLVTTAIFSMDIVHPYHPWAIVPVVFAIAFVLNLTIAYVLDRPEEVWRRIRQALS